MASPLMISAPISGLGRVAPSVRRALQAIRSHDVAADQIDYAILAAINVTLCLSSGGNDRVAEGFNRDLAVSGGRAYPV